MIAAVIVGSVILGLSIVFAAIVVAFGERRTASPVGRYHWSQTGDGTCIVLDTKTGRLWERKAGSPTWSENADAPWVARAEGRKVP
jgi:hypothetical protein